MDLKHVLVKEIFRVHNTKDSSLKVKYRIVLNRLKTSYPVKDGDQSVDFTDLVINLFILQIWHFKRIKSKRIMEELEKKASISEEEANLSQKSA
jgi:hypothetical protein